MPKTSRKRKTKTRSRTDKSKPRSNKPKRPQGRRGHYSNALFNEALGLLAAVALTAKEKKEE